RKKGKGRAKKGRAPGQPETRSPRSPAATEPTSPLSPASPEGTPDGISTPDITPEGTGVGTDLRAPSTEGIDLDTGYPFAEDQSRFEISGTGDSSRPAAVSARNDAERSAVGTQLNTAADLDATQT